MDQPTATVIPVAQLIDAYPSMALVNSSFIDVMASYPVASCGIYFNELLEQRKPICEEELSGVLKLRAATR